MHARNLLVAFVVFAASSAWAGVEYTYRELPAEFSEAFSLFNPGFRNRSVASPHVGPDGTVAIAANNRLLLWKDGVFSSLGDSSSLYGKVRDINGTGAILVDFRRSFADPLAPAIWKDGNLSVRVPTGASGIGFGFNDSGSIVGVTGGFGTQQGVTFSPDAVTPIPGLPAGYQPFVINDSGVMAGFLAPSSGSDRGPYFQSGTTITRLSPERALDGFVRDINADGTAVGWEGPAFDTFLTRPAIFRQDGITSLAGPPGSFGVTLGSAFGINDAGTVVGSLWSFDFSGAVRWRNGVAEPLQDLVQLPGSSTRLLAAYDINDSGQIVGLAATGPFSERVFLLTPIPEPSTVILVGLGLAIVAASRFRRQ